MHIQTNPAPAVTKGKTASLSRTVLYQKHSDAYKASTPTNVQVARS